MTNIEALHQKSGFGAYNEVETQIFTRSRTSDITWLDFRGLLLPRLMPN